METLKDKIALLGFEEKHLPTMYKFMETINSLETSEIQRIKEFLKSKGIIIKRPSQALVYLNGYDYIVNMVNNYEQAGFLQALQENPSRINSKRALERLQSLTVSGLPVLNEKGKYTNDAFSKTLFDSLYNMVPEQQPVPEVSTPEVSDDTTVIEPVTPETVSETFENNVNYEEVTSPISDSTFNENETQPNPEVNDEYSVTEAVVDPISYILSKPQTIALNDETFERYNRLSDNVRQILFKVYGIEEINDTITDNIIKLVTNDIPSDEDIIYKSITYGKTISEEEMNQLKNAIKEELDYTDIMNLSLGR